jgi:transposase InsO family protein
MPWKVQDAMNLKREFVRRLEAGERMSDLCREYGISRETGYTLQRRFSVEGEGGLVPRSRAPKHSRNRASPEVVELVLRARRRHPTWGPRKLKKALERQHRTTLPATSTIGGWLKSHGLVEPRRRPKTVPQRMFHLREATQPNSLWCIDYKGDFRLGDGSRCYPLTLTDQFSRFVLTCDGMASIDGEAALESTLHAFRRYGLPEMIRSDNGAPFASALGLAGLSRLAAAWMRLGIRLERIDPGHPEQNPRHERMHKTLKQDTTRPAAANLLAQQERFDRWVEEFNTVRPHEGIDDRVPTDLYLPSTRRFTGVFPAPSYPLHDDIAVVYSNGHLRVGRHHFFLSGALAGQPIGIREQDDDRWLLTFMDLDLGHLEPRTGKFSPMSTESRGEP